VIEQREKKKRKKLVSSKKKKHWKNKIAVDKSASFAAAGLFRRLGTIHQKGKRNKKTLKEREREGVRGRRNETVFFCAFFKV
jgi:Cft2 family RNA processing exonuclease